VRISEYGRVELRIVPICSWNTTDTTGLGVAEYLQALLGEG
jgi:hypothetical protein